MTKLVNIMQEEEDRCKRQRIDIGTHMMTQQPSDQGNKWYRLILTLGIYPTLAARLSL